MCHKKLEIWQLAHELVIAIHEMTLQKPPKFEMFEEGSQIRRLVKSVKATIALLNSFGVLIGLFETI